MPTVTRRHLLARCRVWIKRLLMQDWTVAVSREPPGDGDIATCEPMSEYKQATLKFDLAQIEPDELEGYVAHELLHGVVHPLANAAAALAGDDKAKQEWVRHAEEAVVEHLQRIVVNAYAATD